MLQFPSLALLGSAPSQKAYSFKVLQRKRAFSLLLELVFSSASVSVVVRDWGCLCGAHPCLPVTTHGLGYRALTSPSQPRMSSHGEGLVQLNPLAQSCTVPAYYRLPAEPPNTLWEKERPKYMYDN